MAGVDGVTLVGVSEADNPWRGFLRRRMAERSATFIENVGLRHLEEPNQVIALRVPKLRIALGTQQTYLLWCVRDSIIQYPFTGRNWGSLTREYEILVAENAAGIAVEGQATALGLALFIPQARGKYLSGIRYRNNDPLETPDRITLGEVWSKNSFGLRIGVQHKKALPEFDLMFGLFVEDAGSMEFGEHGVLPGRFDIPRRIGGGIQAGALNGKLAASIEGIRIDYGGMSMGPAQSDSFGSVLQVKAGLTFFAVPYMPLFLGAANVGPQHPGQEDLSFFTFGTAISFNRFTGLPATPYFREFLIDLAATFPVAGNALTGSGGPEIQRQDVTHSSGSGFFGSLSLIF